MMFLFKFSSINSRLHRGFSNIYFNVRNYCKSPIETTNKTEKDNRDVETVTLNFIKENGKKYQIKGIVGTDLRLTVMQAGMNVEFDYFGFCGGNRWCTSCHVLFEPEIYRTLPKMSSVERHYAEFLLNYKVGALGCQVNVTKEMDGATLRLPKRFPDEDDED